MKQGKVLITPMILVAVLCLIGLIAGLIYGIKTGNWWLLIASLAAVVIGAAWLVRYYYKNVWYICPACHEVFRPAFKSFLFSNHTPNTRKLTCSACGHRGFCVETCKEMTDENT